MVKLNKKRVKELIGLKRYCFSTKYIANKLNLSHRRVQQIYKEYLLTGRMPELGKRAGLKILWVSPYAGSNG